jgi:hypothetical protein
VPAKRGDRAAPPPRPGEYDVRFANTDAAKGWEELCRQAPGNTRTAHDTIRADPCPTTPSPRHHRLRHDRGWGSHDGKTLEQWQYEVTSGGRIWYLVDPDRDIAWVTYAGTGHPKATDR